MKTSRTLGVALFSMTLVLGGCAGADGSGEDTARSGTSSEASASGESPAGTSSSGASSSTSASAGGGAENSSGQSGESQPTQCTDPLSDVTTGDSVRIVELTFCESEAMADLKGYVQSQYEGDTLLSVGRVNIDPLAVDMIPGEAAGAAAVADGTAAGTGLPSDKSVEGQIILTGGSAYYFEDGSWKLASIDSSDSDEAYNATLPARFEVLIDPQRRVKLVDTEATAKIVGADSIDGTPVTIVETEGESGTTRQHITDDYLVIRTETDLKGRKTRTELTQIDKHQEIRAPKVG